jgi:hypothetical protein
LQSKFHRPHLTHDAQKWLLDKIKEELDEFGKTDSKRKWPDNWIIATNIDPSGVPETGSFDKARHLVAEARPQLADRFHIWGGAKILQLLATFPEVAKYYGHFLTPGHILKQVYDQLHDGHASVEGIIRQLVVTQFAEQQYTKLEQAGSPSDQRPGIQKLYTDLPFLYRETGYAGFAVRDLAKASARNHTIANDQPEGEAWAIWQRHPSRARIWLIKGGPGNGKSTIAQFMCQIQRAALLLQPDSPTVTQQQRDLAREVQDVAERSDFWPTTPRIPVSIELKEFAKWFGDREELDSKGILTFLSDRLSQRIEQPVQAGTLKRAFSEAQWLFVFDGLDEVPSDVKAAVAAEVISFVDDLLVSQNCDAQIVCSSRPQGYSGQFDDLAAAVIELTPLKPKLALRCALPVLKIDRTDEEARQYEETLSEALQSPAIEEIMRTPLQAHIMAVVVRDGGRPPDRKWKLFTNFYQTIKRREANRNLPEKRLSALLRSGEKLLKSLHNRLGFELHFRAETKAGAQTSLGRKELGGIVDEIVRQLQEADVAETIQTLMTATTDRLVLVTTPESSDQVRFDIRPLQEFFSAEYLYEDVAADVLGKRLEVISGDAHWREVMHFLLSAIIENSRQTDLVVAIEKLSSLNEGVDGPGRAFYRRLCVGGMIASRLLSEGVLEQDRRIRHQFRRCIEPMFGSTDMDLLEPLVGVTAKESLHWLLDIAADYLAEQTENESLGAAYVLFFLLPDSHSRLQEVVESLNRKSEEYVGCLLELVYRKDHLASIRKGQQLPIPYWAVCWLVRMLASQDWQKLRPQVVRTAFLLLRSNRDLLFEALRSMVFCDTLSNIIVDLVTGHSDPTEPEHEAVDGLFYVSYTGPPPSLVLADWGDRKWSALDEATGVFALIKPILQLALKRSVTDEIQVALQGARQFLTYLPLTLAAFLPSDLQSEDPFEVACANVDGPIVPVWRYKPGYSREVLPDAFEEGVDPASLARAQPSYVLHAVDWKYGEQKLRTFLDSRQGAEVIAEICMLRPELLRQHVGLWGELIKRSESVGRNIRPAILAAAKLTGDFNGGSGSFEPFSLRLPDEAALLPLIVGTFPLAARPDPHNSEPSVAQFVGHFVSDASSLVMVAENEQYPADIRGSAAMMALMHDERSDSSTRMIDTIVGCYEARRETWYLRGAARALEVSVLSEDVRAIEAMGKLLRAGKGDFQGRRQLNYVFQRWREESKAPVHKRGIDIFHIEGL